MLDRADLLGRPLKGSTPIAVDGRFGMIKGMIRNSWYTIDSCFLALLLVFSSGSVLGQDKPEGTPKSGKNYEQCAALQADLNADLGKVIAAGCKPTVAQMSKLMDNPIGNVAMLFNQLDTYKMEKSDTSVDEFKYNYMMLAQFPKKLNDDWNLINRVVFNYTSTPLEQSDIDDFRDKFDGHPGWGTGPGNGLMPPPPDKPLPVEVFDGRTSSLGDTYYVGLFAPSEPTILSNGARWLWGAGFDLGFDTATEDLNGTGKYTAGPSALGVYMGDTFKGGALVQHYWDYAGDSDRGGVNMTNIQYLYYWSISDTMSVGAGPNIIANWEQDSDNRWTVPIGFGINKTFQWGKIPVRVGVELEYTVLEPDDIAYTQWDLRFYVIPAAPSALFSWMQ